MNINYFCSFYIPEDQTYDNCVISIPNEYTGVEALNFAQGYLLSHLPEEVIIIGFNKI
jgi:hypothetical protein